MASHPGRRVLWLRARGTTEEEEEMVVRRDRDREAASACFGRLVFGCLCDGKKLKEGQIVVEETNSGLTVFGPSCPTKPGVGVAEEQPFQQQGVAPGALAPPNRR